MKSVYSAVRTGSLNKAVCASSVKGLFSGLKKLVRVHPIAELANVELDAETVTYFQIYI
jgi:hypothetical protein